METYSIQSLFQSQLSDTNIRLNVPLYQLKAAQAISRCRTAAMGSHAQYCENGHLCGVHFNSCRHRGCPQCQYTVTNLEYHFIFALTGACHELDSDYSGRVSMPSR